VINVESVVALAGVLLAVLIGAISPGPSFVVVARISVSQSRRNGIAAAAGMGVGGATFAVLALLGLKAAFSAMPWLYVALKVVGGMYLLYIGIAIWRGANQPLSVQEAGSQQQDSWWRVFSTALITQLSNPKTAVFYGSIFAALLPQTISLAVTIILPLLVFALEIGWYTVVALVLSSAAPRSVYLRSKVWIDRVAGGVMGLLGLKLITSTDTIL
jgi:RhtB (resistance to homoserine/threonine) family protein